MKPTETLKQPMDNGAPTVTAAKATPREQRQAVVGVIDREPKTHPAPAAGDGMSTWVIGALVTVCLAMAGIIRVVPTYLKNRRAAAEPERSCHDHDDRTYNELTQLRTEANSLREELLAHYRDGY